MKEINLLPLSYQKTRGPQTRRNFILLGIACVFLALMGAFWYHTCKSIEANYQIRIAAMQTKIQSYRPDTIAAEQWERWLGQLEQKRKLWVELSQTDYPWDELLTDIQVRMPQGVLVKSLSFDVSGNMTLEGEASAQGEVALFYQNLLESEYLSNVWLTVEKKEEEKTVTAPNQLPLPVEGGSTVPAETQANPDNSIFAGKIISFNIKAKVSGIKKAGKGSGAILNEGNQDNETQQ